MANLTMHEIVTALPSTFKSCLVVGRYNPQGVAQANRTPGAACRPAPYSKGQMAGAEGTRVANSSPLMQSIGLTSQNTVLAQRTAALPLIRQTLFT
jgi:hypothetical protein